MANNQAGIRESGNRTYKVATAPLSPAPVSGPTPQQVQSTRASANCQPATTCSEPGSLDSGLFGGRERIGIDFLAQDRLFMAGDEIRADGAATGFGKQDAGRQDGDPEKPARSRTWIAIHGVASHSGRGIPTKSLSVCGCFFFSSLWKRLHEDVLDCLLFAAAPTVVLLPEDIV